MAEILYTDVVSDGYDIRVRLSGGRETFFHFQSYPENIQQAVDEMETTYLSNIGVEEVITPQLLPIQDSPIEIEFKKQRDAAKIAAIGFIYSNPECSEEDVIQVASVIAPLLNGAYLLNMYVQGSYSQGIIPEATFESFKGLVLSMTPEQLMEI